MRKLNFKIVTPEKIVYSDEVDFVTLPTTNGEITVAARHTPMVALLKAGELRIKKEQQIVVMAVADGFVEIRPNSQLIVLSDLVERAEEIDEKSVERARARAEKLLKEKENLSDEEHAALLSTLEREMARLNVSKKYRQSVMR